MHTSPLDLRQPVLRVDDVRYAYPAKRRQPARQALCGVSFDIPNGQTVALLGPNGSGKSTLIRMVCGLARPDTGSITLFGSSHLRMPALSVVFQSSGLDKHMTVFENLRDQALLYGLRGHEAKARIDEELSAFDIGDRRNEHVGTLSGGLARRVDLCRALLHRPRMLVLDEPTVGLDPSARQSFVEMLHSRSQDDEMTLLMTTHLVDEADRCDRVIMMNEGAVVGDDSPEVLRESAGSRRLFVDATQPPAIDGLVWDTSGRRHSAALVTSDDEVGDIAARLARSGVSFSIAPPTLADAFEQLTGCSLEVESQEPVS